MVTALFISLFLFVFISAEMAVGLGLGTARIFVFSAVVASLTVIAFIVHPKFSLWAKRDLAVLGGLLLVMLVVHAGTPLAVADLKIVLPLMVLAAAPNIKARLAHLPLPLVVWGLLALFIFAASLPLFLGGAAQVITGYGDYQRLDSTGSVVTLASMAVLLVLLTPAVAGGGFSRTVRLLMYGVGFWGLVVLLLTATRTALVTMVIFWLLMLVAGLDRARTFIVGLVALFGFALVFALYSLLVSDAFLLRLAGSGEVTDYTSGRLHSLVHWFALVAEHPFGLGLGYVRATMAGERPVLDDGLLLEWPHNELVRFFIEGGVIGLLFIGTLLVRLTMIAVRAARQPRPAAEVVLMLAITADIIAQSLLQNYFNAIYHATVMITVLLVVASPVMGQGPARGAQELSRGGWHGRRRRQSV